MLWIMDGAKDCENGVDENENNWKFCGNVTKTTRIVKPIDEECQNVFLCTRQDATVMFDVLCDGIESCGKYGNENQLCARLQGIFLTLSETSLSLSTVTLLLIYVLAKKIPQTCIAKLFGSKDRKMLSRYLEFQDLRSN